jgi:hypothetical protein
VCQFSVHVVDNGEPGDKDTFSIQVTNAVGLSLHNAGPAAIGGGNIQVH